MSECDSTDGIYTQSQIDYAKRVPDHLLRDNLLHVTRLLDNMEGDRDAFEKRCNVLTEQVIELKELLGKQENYE